jgi:predicted dehydrogenase
MNRRNFLVATSAGFSRAAFGANDRVNIVLVGAGGRGRDHVEDLAKIPGATVGGICDTDQSRAERMAALVAKAQGTNPKIYRRLPDVLADKQVDAVTIATCNHWHALATILACQAGKDVYVEKPVSHNVWEGQKMVEAARKYGRIVQAGHQSRCLTHIRQGTELLSQGAIGKVYMARGICYNRRKSIGHQPDGPVPAGVDYDYWLGPAPLRPFNPNRFHYNWHWFWDTGNGDIGNQGVHQLDIARWGLRRDFPKAVFAAGGKFVYDDDQETPNTLTATYDFGDVQMTFEVRGLLTLRDGHIAQRGASFIGNTFFGSDGVMEIDGSGTRVYMGEKRELTTEIKPKEKGEEDTVVLMKNFLAAVKSRKPEDLLCGIEEGHRSAALAHLANISYRTGHKVTFDAERQTIPGDPAAAKLLTRTYRKPWVVPDRV